MVLKVRVWNVQVTPVIYNISKKRRSGVICHSKKSLSARRFQDGLWRYFTKSLRGSGHVLLQKDIFGPPFTFNSLACFLEILVLLKNMLQVLLANFLDVFPLSKCPGKIFWNVIMPAKKQKLSKIMSHSAHLEMCRCL